MAGNLSKMADPLVPVFGPVTASTGFAPERLTGPPWVRGRYESGEAVYYIYQGETDFGKESEQEKVRIIYGGFSKF